MANETEERLLRIKVDNTQALAAISSLRGLIDQLTGSNKKLTDQNKDLAKQLTQLAKAGKQGGSEFALLNALLEKNKTQILSNSKAVEQYNKDLDENTKQITKNISDQRNSENSLKSLKSYLNGLIAEYERMDKTERESMDGQALRDKIKGTGDFFKQAKEALGLNNLNIDNFGESIRNIVNVLKNADGGFLTTVKNIKKMSESAGGLGNLLKGSFKTALQKVGDTLSESTGGLGNLLKGIFKTALQGAEDTMSEGSGGLGGRIKEGLKTALQKVGDTLKGLVKTPVTGILSGASKGISSLSKLFQSIGLDKISGVLDKADGGINRLIGKMNDGAGTLSKWLEKIPLIGDKFKEVDNADSFYKVTFDLISQGVEKLKTLRKKQYEEDLAAAKGTEEQKARICEELTEAYRRDVAAIDAKYSQEALDKAVAARTEEMNAELELAREEIDEQLAVKLDLLAQEKAAAIQNAEETGDTVEEIEASYAQRAADLEEQAEQDRMTARSERLAQLLTDTVAAYQEDLENLVENEATKTEVELAEARVREEALRALDAESKAEMFASEEEYEAALEELVTQRRELEQQAAEESKQTRLAAIQDAQAKMDSISGIAGSIADLFNQIGGDNETMQKFLKATALFQIGIDMAKAIAGAVAGAMDVGFPACIPAMVAALAAVTAGIVQAKQTLSQQKEEPAPKFAAGGLVTGPGSGTSDSVPAMLSNGESVMTAAATAMFAPMLSAMNVAGGGVPLSVTPVTMGLDIDDMMTEAVIKAFATMPSPVVSVEEINAVENRIKVAESNMYY